ncbi:YopX family protein [Streptococcus uberis]|uniref:YopX family protein n=1 Tax=Streptococcus uberis TaxID=1349 RepID=UPI001FF2399C|nr:YopX family protein [Streptococcus uberis]MCK1222629.1 YopX family protein [Streptococcus uberis]
MIPKFRVWDTVKKAMHDVQAIVYTEERVYPIYSKLIRKYIPFGEAILMQYTGLKDKNGVEVFEGDILYYPEQDEDRYGYIEFDKDRLAFVLDNGFEKFVYGEYGMGYIVGNIYENPELLESVEE